MEGRAWVDGAGGVVMGWRLEVGREVGQKGSSVVAVGGEDRGKKGGHMDQARASTTQRGEL